VSAYDAVIVGGGIIGGSIAFELAAERLRIVLVDRQQPGGEASWAAAGMLSPGPHSPADKALVPFAKESLGLYPEFIAAVEECCRQKTEFVRHGAIEIFSGPRAEAERDEFIELHRQLGIQAERLEAEAARRVEPALGPAARAVARIEEEATVDPRLLTQAVLESAKARGVEIRAGCKVTSLLCKGNRCTGVATRREEISAGLVILAAGCFTEHLAQTSDGPLESIPTRPVRGQMISMRQAGVALRQVLRSGKGYLVPRADGRIVAGSTLEEAGFEKRVTPEGMQKILAATLELVPQLSGAQILETWAGLRPGTPDDLPIVGPTSIKGLFAATGHYRNGILLSPSTARATKNWVKTGKLDQSIEPFSPLRFKKRVAVVNSD
jgi:glycine oxidase